MFKAHFSVTLQVPNLQLSHKVNSTASIFQSICLPFKNTCFKENFKENSNNFEMQYIVSNSRCICLYFQLLQLAWLTDRWLTFYETRMNRLMAQHLLSSEISKREEET